MLQRYNFFFNNLVTLPSDGAARGKSALTDCNAQLYNTLSDGAMDMGSQMGDGTGAMKKNNK